VICFPCFPRYVFSAFRSIHAPRLSPPVGFLSRVLYFHFNPRRLATTRPLRWVGLLQASSSGHLPQRHCLPPQCRRSQLLPNTAADEHMLGRPGTSLLPFHLGTTTFFIICMSQIHCRRLPPRRQRHGGGARHCRPPPQRAVGAKV
jgi:hypothetical protein